MHQHPPISSYYRTPFGSAMANRGFSSGVKYRYGFGSQEKDDEISGEGNRYSADFWQHDSRLGRRFNLDPVIKDWESPYACFSDNPIYFTDIKGDNSNPFNGDERKTNYKKEDGTQGTCIE